MFIDLKNMTVADVLKSMSIESQNKLLGIKAPEQLGMTQSEKEGLKVLGNFYQNALSLIDKKVKYMQAIFQSEEKSGKMNIAQIFGCNRELNDMTKWIVECAKRTDSSVYSNMKIHEHGKDVYSFEYRGHFYGSYETLTDDIKQKYDIPITSKNSKTINEEKLQAMYKAFQKNQLSGIYSFRPIDLHHEEIVPMLEELAVNFENLKIEKADTRVKYFEPTISFSQMPDNLKITTFEYLHAQDKNLIANMQNGRLYTSKGQEITDVFIRPWIEGNILNGLKEDGTRSENREDRIFNARINNEVSNQRMCVEDWIAFNRSGMTFDSMRVEVLKGKDKYSFQAVDLRKDPQTAKASEAVTQGFMKSSKYDWYEKEGIKKECTFDSNYIATRRELAEKNGSYQSSNNN